MVEERMEALAARQHGLITAGQCAALGLTASAIRHRRRKRSLVQVAPRVYRLAGAVETPHLRVLTAVLASGPDASTSHTTAAALLRLPGFSLEPVVLSIPRSRRPRWNGARVEQSLALLAHHRRIVDDIPCTSVARTVFDLCGDVHPRRAERALDTALARRIVTVPALWQVLDELAERGRRGSTLLRELLQARGPRYVPPESELEARFIELVRAFRLPELERQVDLGDTDTWIGRVDFLWRAARLVVEVDGAQHHGALLDRRADASRDARLTASGWTVLRFRWSDIVDDPAAVVAAIRIRCAIAS